MADAERAGHPHDDAGAPTGPDGPSHAEETVDRLEEKILGGRAPDGVEPPPDDAGDRPAPEPPD